MYSSNLTNNNTTSSYGFTMSVRTAVRRQYGTIVDDAAMSTLQTLKRPKEGWIACVRKSLGMSAAQLGRIVNRTRANISNIEKSEINERTTLQTMQTLAEAMGCKFVYAIVPAEGSIEDVLQNQARKKALALVGEASTHMALEKQALSDEKLEAEVQRITRELLDNQPSDFWEVE